MGADMLVSTIWLAEGTEPDWPAAEKAIDQFTCPPEGFPERSALSGSLLEEEILERYETENATSDQDRKAIVDTIVKEAYSEVKEGIEGRRRDMTWSIYAGWVVFITGGPSWGETPTSSYEAIIRLDGTGILEAAGFYKKPDTVIAVLLESDYDTTITLVADKDAAEREVAGFCREFWDRVVDDPNRPKPPESDRETIERFFANAPASWSELRKPVSTKHLPI